MTDAGAPLWTADEVGAAVSGRVADGAKDWAAAGVSIDSRTVASGDLFVAIAGPHFDGHDFAAAALAAGAAAAIVSHVPAGLSADAPLVVVDDTLAALWQLGAAARERMTGRVAAVTGSVGKTGTKDALRAALARFAPTHASAASYNNQWGVPLSLARMPRDASYAVFEIGMNHAGEIEPLARLVRPHLAIVTTVEPVHLAFFDSVSAIADAKAEIFRGVEAGVSPCSIATTPTSIAWRHTPARAACEPSSASAPARKPTPASSAPSAIPIAVACRLTSAARP